MAGRESFLQSPCRGSLAKLAKRSTDTILALRLAENIKLQMSLQFSEGHTDEFAPSNSEFQLCKTSRSLLSLSVLVQFFWYLGPVLQGITIFSS